jgi:soluble lytic murein transglycosylase-like protein
VEPPFSSSPDDVGRADLLRQRRQKRVLVAGLAVLLAGGVAALVVTLTGGASGPAPRLVPRAEGQASDPLAYTPAQDASLERAAAQGYAQVLYTKSPGGVVAAARRTARYRTLVEKAVAGTGIDPDLLEAIVFLESAGRPDVIAGSDPASAAGLTQILAETAVDFLGMHVDLAKSRTLTAAIAKAQARGDAKAVRALEARRRLVDARFDPAQALAGAVRYLVTAEQRFGRADLAVVSYHMGIGNLQGLLHDYAGDGTTVKVKRLVARDDLSWPRVYFDSSPASHRSAWVRLASFGDDSQTYFWRVLAAREIMRLYRSDPTRLAQLAALHGQAESAEDALHPPAETDSFATPGDLESAWRHGVVQPLPSAPAAFHLRVAPTMGSLAGRLGKGPGLYRGLRPEALALLLYLAGRVHAFSGAPALIVATTVLDEDYRKLLPPGDPNAGGGSSLLTTGWAFDIRRDYASPAQAAAFQYELERLQARNLIAWIRTPSTIHVTVSSAAQALVPALLRTAPTAA